MSESTTTPTYMTSSRGVEALCLERRERRRLESLYSRETKEYDEESPPAARVRILTNNTLPRSGYGAFTYTSRSSNKSNRSNNSIEQASTSSSLSSLPSLEGIPVPLKLRPFVKRLAEFAELTDEEVYGILFIIRMADAMLKVAYASFLTRSFVDELRKKLKLEDLDLEIEIASTRWTYQQGAIMTYHRFASDYDGYAMQELSRIALGVLEDSISVTEGLHKIQVCEEWTSTTEPTTEGLKVKEFRGFERSYRQFSGRIFVFPLLAAFGCIVYFGGTVVDFLVCLFTGTVAGIIHYLCSKHPQLTGVEEFLIAVTTSILCAWSTVLFPGAVCFRAQILGSLFCFLYGISFIMSLYEITQNLVITGLTRFCLAVLKTFGLGFGVAIGLWVAGYGSPDRFVHIASKCSNSGPLAVDPIWFPYIYPFVAMGALMHLRVSPKHWFICMLTQLLALKSQYLLSIAWKQPMFVANFIPAFLATITAHVLIVTLHKLHLTKLAVEPTAFLLKKLKPKKDMKEPLITDTPETTLLSPMSSNVVRFVDTGWADQGETRNGYRRNNRFQYQRSDLWFCLMPSLYLLVPGAAIWDIAFFSIVESSSQEAAAINETSHLSFQAMIAVLFVVGMGQVMGVRFALFSLWAFTEVWRKLPFGDNGDQQ